MPAMTALTHASSPPVERPRTRVAGTRTLHLAHTRDRCEDVRLQLRIRSVQFGEYTMASLAGELDLVTFDRLRDALLELLDRQAVPRLVLDLADVTFADARGLSPLVRASCIATTRGGWVRLVRVSDRLQRILDAARLTQTLPTYDTVAEAATSARRLPST